MNLFIGIVTAAVLIVILMTRSKIEEECKDVQKANKF